MSGSVAIIQTNKKQVKHPAAKQINAALIATSGAASVFVAVTSLIGTHIFFRSIWALTYKGQRNRIIPPQAVYRADLIQFMEKISPSISLTRLLIISAFIFWLFFPLLKIKGDSGKALAEINSSGLYLRRFIVHPPSLKLDIQAANSTFAGFLLLLAACHREGRAFKPFKAIAIFGAVVSLTVIAVLGHKCSDKAVSAKCAATWYALNVILVLCIDFGKTVDHPLKIWETMRGKKNQDTSGASMDTSLWPTPPPYSASGGTEKDISNQKPSLRSPLTSHRGTHWRTSRHALGQIL